MQHVEPCIASITDILVSVRHLRIKSALTDMPQSCCKAFLHPSCAAPQYCGPDLMYGKLSMLVYAGADQRHLQHRHGRPEAHERSKAESCCWERREMTSHGGSRHVFSFWT